MQGSMHNTERGLAGGAGLAWGRCVRDFVVGMFRQLTVKGFLWAAAGPFTIFLLFYGLVLHVWFSLGRWPHFGEHFQNRFLELHSEAVIHVGGIIGLSLMLAPVVGFA